MIKITIHPGHRHVCSPRLVAHPMEEGLNNCLLVCEGAEPPAPLFASKYAATPNAGLRPATPRIRHDSDLS